MCWMDSHAPKLAHFSKFERGNSAEHIYKKSVSLKKPLFIMTFKRRNEVKRVYWYVQTVGLVDVFFLNQKMMRHHG